MSAWNVLVARHSATAAPAATPPDKAICASTAPCASIPAAASAATSSIVITGTAQHRNRRAARARRAAKYARSTFAGSTAPVLIEPAAAMARISTRSKMAHRRDGSTKKSLKRDNQELYDNECSGRSRVPDHAEITGARRPRHRCRVHRHRGSHGDVRVGAPREPDDGCADLPAGR